MKPYIPPFRVADYAASPLLYMRELLANRANYQAKLVRQRELKLARDARYRERKRTDKAYAKALGY